MERMEEAKENEAKIKNGRGYGGKELTVEYFLMNWDAHFALSSPIFTVGLN